MILIFVDHIRMDFLMAISFFFVYGLKHEEYSSPINFQIFHCFIVLVVFFVTTQSSESIYAWFRKKLHFLLNFISYHIFAIYVSGASLGLSAACGLIAVSETCLPSVDALTVRCIKMHHHVQPAITCLQFSSNIFMTDTCAQTHRDSAPVCVARCSTLIGDLWKHYWFLSQHE